MKRLLRLFLLALGLATLVSFAQAATDPTPAPAPAQHHTGKTVKKGQKKHKKHKKKKAN